MGIPDAEKEQIFAYRLREKYRAGPFLRPGDPRDFGDHDPPTGTPGVGACFWITVPPVRASYRGSVLRRCLLAAEGSVALAGPLNSRHRYVTTLSFSLIPETMQQHLRSQDLADRRASSVKFFGRLSFFFGVLTFRNADNLTEPIFNRPGVIKQCSGEIMKFGMAPKNGPKIGPTFSTCIPT